MRFKSVLGAFVFIIMASSIALVHFIQTESFGKLLTKMITDVSYKRHNVRVKIKNISISYFPPGVELNDLEIENAISPQKKFEGSIGKMGLFFSLLELEDKRFTFGEIRISNSILKISGEQDEEPIKEIDKRIIDQIFSARDHLPLKIDTLTIEDSKLALNHELLEAKKIKIIQDDKSFLIRFHLANVVPYESSDLRIDEIWGDGEIFKNRINIHRLKLLHNVHMLIVKGHVKNYPKLKDSEVNLNGEGNVDLTFLNHDLTIPESIHIKKGHLLTTFNIAYTGGQLAAETDSVLREFRSNIVYADELKTKIHLKNNQVVLDSLEMTYKKESLKLIRPAELFSFTDKKLLRDALLLKVENLSLHNALRYLGKKMKPLVGELSGALKFSLENNNLHFLPQEKFIINNLGLVTGTKEKKFPIISTGKIVLNKSRFSVVNKEFQMRAGLELARSKMDVEGNVGNGKVYFSVPNASINLQDLGNIANLDIKGAGNLDVKVKGPTDDVTISIAGRTNDFEILGYKLGKAEKDISIELADSIVIINKLESVFGRTSLSGNGSVNYGDSEIALGIGTTDAVSSDLLQIIHPIFKNIESLPDDLDFKAKIDVDIFGKYKLPELKLRSKVNFTDLTAYGENFRSGSVNIGLLNKILTFKDLEIQKGKGLIKGDFSLDLNDKKMKLGYKWDNLELSSFNIVRKLDLNFDAKMSGEINGGGKPDDYLINLNGLATNTKNSNYTFNDSVIALKLMPDRLKGSTKFFGETIISDFNLSLKKGKASDLKFKFVSDDLKPLIVAFVGDHLLNENFLSKMNFELQTKFQDELNNLSLSANLKEFLFVHPDFSVDYKSNSPEFVVENSIIKKWNLAINQPSLRVKSFGTGVFGKKVSLEQESNFDSKIFEILFAPILSADGNVSSLLRLSGTGIDFDFFLSSQAEDLDISIDRLPVQINDLKYHFEANNNRVNIKYVTTSFDSGSASLKGDIYFDSQLPDVNLKFVIDKAEIPILGKSSMNVSGEGILLGNSPPYTLGGEIVLNKAQIVNELNEFSSKSAGFSQIRFLPKNKESSIGKLINLNLNVKADNPVRISNSLMDIALVGEVRLLGGLPLPQGEGKLSTPPNSSRIYFKNNEYQIVSADINFSPKKAITNPDFDVQSLTVISNYKVYPKAYGDLERFNFDLTSDPALPRNSILSLIAFGYTDEIQTSLYARDQQNLTQVGVGSFVFDRFKISDILNKQFGLQVNLGTVIEQSESESLLSGRSQDGGGPVGNGGIGRTRSATKIELKKRLDEALTLSVSSTMGGSIGQRQSMNLNYGLTKNIQVEGVYELRTNEEGEADIIYDSIGGDIKFRRTFK